MKKKDTNYYFNAFVESFNYTCKAANYLESAVINFNDKITDDQKNEMHVIEHSADLFLHDVLAKLAVEFITPIANEDILAVIKKIDDATDTIEDVLIKMYIHNITKLPSCAKEFVNIIKRECEALASVLAEFKDFKKSNTIREKVMEVLKIEEEGDKVYMSSIKDLYTNESDPKELYLTEDLINSFEKCCDTVEDVAQVVDEAIMKNN